MERKKSQGIDIDFFFELLYLYVTIPLYTFPYFFLITNLTDSNCHPYFTNDKTEVEKVSDLSTDLNLSLI